MTVRENPYARLRAEFEKQTAGHELTVLSDHGLERRLYMRDPAMGGIWSWQVVTWPGYLATVGDVADGFVFSRVDDMLDFFDCRRHGSYSDGSPEIDFRYWAEKLRGRNGKDPAVRRFSASRLTALVADCLEESDLLSLEAIELVRDELGPDRALALAEQRAEILADAAEVGAQDDERLARDWLERHGDLVGQDSYWEADLDEWNTHFLYACWAIEKTVRAYHAQHATSPDTDADTAATSAADRNPVR